MIYKTYNIIIILPTEIFITCYHFVTSSSTSLMPLEGPNRCNKSIPVLLLSQLHLLLPKHRQKSFKSSSNWCYPEGITVNASTVRLHPDQSLHLVVCSPFFCIELTAITVFGVIACTLMFPM